MQFLFNHKYGVVKKTTSICHHDLYQVTDSGYSYHSKPFKIIF